MSEGANDVHVKDPIFGSLTWNDSEGEWQGAASFRDHSIQISVCTPHTRPELPERLATLESNHALWSAFCRAEPHLRQSALRDISNDLDWGYIRRSLLSLLASVLLRPIEVALHGTGEVYYSGHLWLRGGTVTVFFGARGEYEQAELSRS